MAKRTLVSSLAAGVAVVAVVVAIAAPASGGPPSARVITESGSEVLRIPAKAAVPGQTAFVPGKRYLVNISGTITRSTGGELYTFDPFYFQDHASRPEIQNGLDMYFGADRQGPTYFSSAYGDTGWPAYRADHRYSFVIDSRFPPGTATWEALPFWQSDNAYSGAFRVEITPLCAPGGTAREDSDTCEPPPKVKFSFVQKNLVGLVRSETFGQGTLKLPERPTLRPTRKPKTFFAIANFLFEGPKDTVTVRHIDEYVAREDDRLTLSMTSGRYLIYVTPKAVYETIQLDGEVTKSDDDDCPVGKPASIEAREPKGRGGKSGRVRVMIACKGHQHGSFTERQQGDRVLVKVDGPKPKPPKD